MVGQELVFTVDQARAVGATPLSFADASLRERDHLQEWVLAHPQILGDDVLVLTSEYDGFESADGSPVYDRLDVLALDRSGRLVVAELKRDRAPSTVTMQALNYAAMMSRFSLDDVAAIYAKHRSKQGLDADLALLELRAWAPEVSDETLGPPAIVLVASEFAPQVTNTAMFLFENHLDIRLVQTRLYRPDDGHLVLTTSQLLPVPNAENFMMRPRSGAATQAAAREERARRASITQRLVEAGRFRDGERLRIIVPSNVDQDRETIEKWLAEDPQRAAATWRPDVRKPVQWAVDGQAHSFTELITRVIEEATQLPPRSQVWGPNWIVDPTGTPLHKVADRLGESAE